MTIAKLHEEFLASGIICTDTRKQVSGSLFFALKGENFDGNRFVEDALAKGCRLAISDSRELEGSQRVLFVPSVIDTLQQLAHFHRMKASPRVLAITGSNGKTTTKELVSVILSRKFSVLATPGNLNNHIGVPLTLLSLDKEELAVIEMGANHPGEIAKLAEIAAPELGMITNVGKAHLEGFGSLEGVADAKSELYEYLSANGGSAIIDGNDPLLLKKAVETGVKTLVVGQNGNIEVSGRIVSQAPFLEVEMDIEGEKILMGTRLVGAYNLQNIILAAATGIHLGVPVNSIVDSVSEYIPDNQRSQVIEGGGNRIILDAYNANPTSMREAISALMEYASPPVMLILGDMAELGDNTLDEHRELLGWIMKQSVDRVILAGPIFTETGGPSSRLSIYRDTSDLKVAIRSENPTGFNILIKGSRIMGLENLIPDLVGGREF
ncbi:MAG: UDP-N-acetylmuramoyl-tripeptide--D-alanyl-D-alanine ligase [Anaerolineales bacterium]|nr:UDP-N-acetylmuramoyl-tripeptide--D-alanyl-D-alanine ligase [Anaerolineales bacterium]